VVVAAPCIPSVMRLAGSPNTRVRSGAQVRPAKGEGSPCFCRLGKKREASGTNFVRERDEGALCSRKGRKRHSGGERLVHRVRRRKSFKGRGSVLWCWLGENREIRWQVKERERWVRVFHRM
jgi:hypothetical protein